MKIFRAYKAELDPTDKQRTLFQQCAGTSRFVFNWGLAEWENWYADNGNPSSYSLRRYLNSFKKTEFPWMVKVPYAIIESAFGNLNSAFQRYFKEKKDGTTAKRISELKTQGKWDKRVKKLSAKGRHGYQLDPGYPQFKRKGKDDSFQLRNSYIGKNKVRLTHIGWVNLKEHRYIPTSDSSAKFGTYATISRQANKWYISVLVEEDIPIPQTKTFSLGIDFGLRSLAVCSDGTIFENPHALEKLERKLKRLQRESSRRQIGGQNWKKTKAKIGRCHAKIANVRKHAQHQISYYVTAKAKPQTIVLEDLNVKGMMQNQHLSKAISDVGWAELRRQIEYKAGWYGNDIIIADRFYPSSKRCSKCGSVKPLLKLSERTYVCEICGNVIDRDRNAAVNLAILGEGGNTAGLSRKLGRNEAPL